MAKEKITNHLLDLLGLSFLLLFVGCATVGPDYVPPEKKVPEEFSTKLEAVKIESPKTEEEKEGLPPVPVKKVTPEMLGDWWQTLEL